MANPILIVHGWSDNYESFVPLQEWLTQQFGAAEQVFFANYESMENHITFDDLAAGLQDRFDGLASEGKLKLDPFSLDVIVHSTGGPVMRHWLYHYLMDTRGGDLTKCPILRLIMLAPANFGSKLAAQGKSVLAKLFKGGLSKGFETGDLILDGLELGSPDLWEMAADDLVSKTRFYPCVNDKGPFVFIFSGTDTYGKLKGLVAPGANEDGSDGTIRASAASLNSIKIEVDCRNPSSPTPKVIWSPNNPIAFRVVPGVNHTGIVPRAGAPSDHPTYDLIKRCMGVSNGSQYATLVQQFDQETAAFYASQGKKSVDKYQQFVVHVCDEFGNDVLDYRLEFHIIDNSIVRSDWNVPPDQVETSEAFKALQKYASYTEIFQNEVVADVATHSKNTSYRTFFINIDRWDKLQAQMKQEVPGAYLGMNVDAAGATTDLGYATDQLRYLRVEVPIKDNQGRQADFFCANTTTLVEIQLLNVPTKGVIQIGTKEDLETDS